MNPDFKDKYLELQMLNQEIKQLQQQFENAEKQLEELNKLDEVLDDFAKVKAGSETLSAIGSGIFAKTEIKNTKEILMAVGANIYVTKPIGDAKEFIAAQIKEVQDVTHQIENAVSDAICSAQGLQEELQAEAKKKKK